MLIADGFIDIEKIQYGFLQKKMRLRLDFGPTRVANGVPLSRIKTLLLRFVLVNTFRHKSRYALVIFTSREKKDNSWK